jgi:hypothetical protein
MFEQFFGKRPGCQRACSFSGLAQTDETAEIHGRRGGVERVEKAAEILPRRVDAETRSQIVASLRECARGKWSRRRTAIAADFERHALQDLAVRSR